VSYSFAARPGRHHERRGEPGPPPDLSSDLCGAVVDRLIQANSTHSRLAAENRGTADALSAHALALFSTDRTAYPFQLSTAIRLDDEEEDGEDMLEMLDKLAAHAEEQVARARMRGQRWDPREPVTGIVGTSEARAEHHVYVGLAVSTLDRLQLPWREARTAIQRDEALRLPGQGFIYLADGTAVHLVRGAMLGPLAGAHQIAANRLVRSPSGHRVRRDDELMLDPAGKHELPPWPQLRTLHEVLASA
jgi:hypothetical protein